MRIHPVLCAIALSSGFAASAASAADPVACKPAAFAPEQFQVAIDRASGITFIHSPCGWEYVGIVARGSIDDGVKLSSAKPIPAEVLRAAFVLQPWLRGMRDQAPRAGRR